MSVKAAIPATGIEYRMVLNDFSFVTHKAIEPVEKMISPVVCGHCGMIYDLAAGKVVHRYGDCDQYKTPCCDMMADTREYKSFPDFKKFDASKFDLVEA